MPLPVSLNVLSIVLFLALLAVVVWRDRANIERYSIVLVRRTKHGIDYLDRIAEVSPRLWKLWSTLGVGIGFIGMAIVFVAILQQTLRLFLVGGATPPVAPVLPTVSTTTNPQEAGYLGLPFWHFMISLSVVLVVHEVMHGVIARVEGFDIEYVGLLLIGILPGAFVQPEGQRDFFEPEDDTEETGESSPWGNGSPLSRLRVLAAGPMANITVAALLFLVLQGAFTTAHGPPELRGAYEHGGMRIVNVGENSPAEAAGLQQGMVVTAMANHPTQDLAGFQTATENFTVNQTVTVVTRGNGTFTVQLGPHPRPTGNISYTPAPVDYLLPVLEQQFPGTIDTYEQYNDMVAGEDDLTLRIGRWRWIQQHYPPLEAAAARHIQRLQGQQGADDAGFMGIRVVPDREVRPAFASFVQPLFLLSQIVFFVALLNLMIGLANLLPVKGLDGGWMLDTLLQEKMPGQADRIVRSVTLLTVAMIGISFAFLISRHLL
ncbi:MAG: site-2 protease family protein [Candidatus Nanohaloarchaea archaeon]|nr:site-2 protease family protein [Candidatus Nanohaloarchaea archaeon]